MDEDHLDCARFAALLARMDRPPRGDDPSSALAPDELDRLAAHLDACSRCAHADESAAAPLLAALREGEDLDAPPDDVLAERRAALLGTLLAGEGPLAAPATGVAVPSSAARARRAPRSHAGGAGGAWKPWAAAGLALAAGLVLLLTGVLRHARDAVPARDAASLAAQVSDDDAVALLDADDDSALATGELLALDEPSGGRTLDHLTRDELDEVEGVLVSMPGWS